MFKKLKSRMTNACLTSLGACLSLAAVVFANAACKGILYEPTVPEELKR